jgi:hypothetical protein
MTNANLFWPVYLNLEREVLALTNDIYFSDSQVNVFSVKCAELLLRCAVEIEALSKQIYEENGGDMTPKDENGDTRFLNYDFDCLKKLDIDWKLGKKVVLISAPTMYFEKDEYKILHPLKNAHKGDVYWQKAYQAVKHNRSKDINKANIKNTLGALAALFLLNLYYKDEKIELKHEMKSVKPFDVRVGSSIFSIKLFRATTLHFGGTTITDKAVAQGVGDFYDSIYIEKFSEASYIKIYNSKLADNKNTELKFQQHFEQHRNQFEGKDFEEIVELSGGENFLKWLFTSTSAEIYQTAKREFIVNKHAEIYPSLPEELPNILN